MFTSERNHLTVCAGLEGNWATCTGGDSSRTVTRVRDGGERKSKVIINDGEPGDLTISRPFDSARDASIERQLRQIVDDGGSFETTVTKTPTDNNFVRIGEPRTWQVELLQVRGPEGNRDSNNPTRLELVFAVI